jgi:hypothetical protein
MVLGIFYKMIWIGNAVNGLRQWGILKIFLSLT